MNYAYTDELCHFGIKGMKWGVRRFQNEDGSYTAAGKQRRTSDKGRSHDKKATAKKVVIGAAVTTGVLLAAYGGYKLSNSVVSKKLASETIKKMALQEAEQTANKRVDAYNKSNERLGIQVGYDLAGEILKAYGNKNVNVESERLAKRIAKYREQYLADSIRDKLGDKYVHLFDGYDNPARDPLYRYGKRSVRVKNN